MSFFDDNFERVKGKTTIIIFFRIKANDKVCTRTASTAFNANAQTICLLYTSDAADD